jgi:isopentenyldiphosphate isomerase
MLNTYAHLTILLPNNRVLLRRYINSNTNRKGAWSATASSLLLKDVDARGEVLKTLRKKFGIDRDVIDREGIEIKALKKITNNPYEDMVKNIIPFVVKVKSSIKIRTEREYEVDIADFDALIEGIEGGRINHTPITEHVIKVIKNSEFPK